MPGSNDVTFIGLKKKIILQKQQLVKVAVAGYTVFYFLLLLFAAVIQATAMSTCYEF